ncbi:hypothetical protein [Methylobacterium radiodurans]|uniref:Lipocalin-like domain-containing protein n=1 Tax=Methylobacterium radiodurans TaxID=2202828 RepID=A0A2U8VS98_9HYPH|nr:hypothetical protein [Methylobacterium radiodurans]AWN36270.1 hypothetical protein DK427_11505 [Methylobacterium radiodurans]
MARFLSSLCAALCVGPALVGAVSAQPAPIEGTWQQVETNAGSCRSCRIEITREAGALRIVANNGWSALVDDTGDRNRFDARGTGSWQATTKGWVAGRAFDITVLRVVERLHITMRVEMPDGSGRLVHAVFKRIWLGV